MILRFFYDDQLNTENEKQTKKKDKRIQHLHMNT